MPADTHDASNKDVHGVLQTSESTAFLMWLLITVSAGIIMAQDSWLGLQQPRLSTVDATASFTKVLVIHAIWLLATLGFLGFTWFVRPTSAWKVHMVVGALTVLWTVGVLVWAFSDVERLEVSTWRCEVAPASDTVTPEFLESCSLAEMGSSIRLGGDIFLWSADDEHFWRWIVPGEGLSTLQAHWPSHVNAVYLATDAADATLISSAGDSVPGGKWSAGFNPAETRSLRIYFVEAGPTVPIDRATPDAFSHWNTTLGQLYHDRFKFAE